MSLFQICSEKSSSKTVPGADSWEEPHHIVFTVKYMNIYMKKSNIHLLIQTNNDPQNTRGSLTTLLLFCRCDDLSMCPIISHTASDVQPRCITSVWTKLPWTGRSPCSSKAHVRSYAFTVPPAVITAPRRAVHFHPLAGKERSLKNGKVVLHQNVSLWWHDAALIDMNRCFQNSFGSTRCL